MKELKSIHDIYSEAPKLFRNHISGLSLTDLVEGDSESLINDFLNKNCLPLNAISIDETRQPEINQQAGTLTVYVQQARSNTLNRMNSVALQGGSRPASLNVYELEVNTTTGALTTQCVGSAVELKHKKSDLDRYLQNLTETIELHNKTGSQREQLHQAINQRITELEREKKARRDLEDGTGFKIVDGA